MKFSFTYPMVSRPYDPAFVGKPAVTRIARAAELAGFDAIAFTEHPIPTQRWLDHGGHDAFEPFAALAFCAAITDRIELLTNISVLPYRNPFHLAKAVATVDVLSGGRMILGTGVGYQKGEYKALGVDFDERNALFDEAIEVMKLAWTTDDLTYEGLHFTALGNTADPKPVRKPHPPIWIGGNSKLARRRVARAAQCWNPFPAPRVMATTARTVALETIDDLAALLDDLWIEVEKAGRDDRPDVAFVCAKGGSPGDDAFEPDAHLGGLAELEALGVTWVGVGMPGDSVDATVEALERYGADVIAQQR